MSKIEDRMVGSIYDAIRSNGSYYWKKDNTLVFRGMFANDEQIIFIKFHGYTVVKMFMSYTNTVEYIEISKVIHPNKTRTARVNAILHCFPSVKNNLPTVY